MRSSAALVAAMLLAMCGCSAQPAAQTAQAPARAPDRFIYVSADGVPSSCYHDLGEVGFAEPFSDAAMDEDGVRMADKLRRLAMLKYPDTADAVIKVRSQENDVGTIVNVTGEVVELQQGQHTVECAMRKAPGVINTAAAVAAGGMLGAVAGGLAGGTAGMMAAGPAGAGAVGAYMALEQHRATQRERAKLKTQLAAQQNEIAQLLARRSSLQKCVDDEIRLADCKIDDAVTTVSAPAHPAAAAAPAYETEQPQVELEKQIQEQQGYIRKLSDQVFELQRQLGDYSAKPSQ